MRDVVLFVVVRAVLAGSWRSEGEGSVRSRVGGAGVSMTEGMSGGIEESTVVIGCWVNSGVAQVLQPRSNCRYRVRSSSLYYGSIKNRW